MNDKQWQEMLSAINKEEDLNKDNVIKKVKKALKKFEYQEEEDDFCIDYLFKVGADKFTFGCS